MRYLSRENNTRGTKMKKNKNQNVQVMNQVNSLTFASQNQKTEYVMLSINYLSTNINFYSNVLI